MTYVVTERTIEVSKKLESWMRENEVLPLEVDKALIYIKTRFEVEHLVVRGSEDSTP